jgi:ribulose-phosphate 3-epimerase
MNHITIHPSLISSDLLNLEKTIRTLEPHCDGFHIDIMDNHFVPRLTWGEPFVTAISRATKKQLALHLMIDHPLLFLKKVTLPPQSIAIIHIESKCNISDFINYSKENNLKASLAIQPKTPLHEIFSFLDVIDHVLLMSVEPGSSGQQFIPTAYDRLTQLVGLKKEKALGFTISMDGGISPKNIAQLVQMGCEQFAIASAIFDAPDYVEALTNLYDVSNG